MKKAMIIINEQHSLTQEQVDILNNTFDDYEFYKVPAEGWTLEEMENIVFAEGENVVFISPVPYLLAKFSKAPYYNVYIFHNDKREKKELPNGKVVYTISNTGWQLLEI